jgi:hypothetical protein
LEETRNDLEVLVGRPFGNRDFFKRILGQEILETRGVNVLGEKLEGNTTFMVHMQSFLSFSTGLMTVTGINTDDETGASDRSLLSNWACYPSHL